MQRISAVIKLGFKYLLRYLRRYYFLIAAMIFCFTVVTFITSTKDGMYDNVYYSAQSHYAGDIVAVGHNYNEAGEFIHHMDQGEISAVLSASDMAEVNPQHIIFRTFFVSNPIIHYNGAAVQLKNLMGCDWERESFLFNEMNFEYPLEYDIDDEGIIISSPVALQLGVRMGDSVMLELDTRFHQKNTGMFIVKGIIQDTSIFGYYKAYISRAPLNRLLLFNDEDCSTIGFFLDKPASAGQKRIRLQNFLSEKTQTGDLIYDREGMINERDKPWKGSVIFLYTLPVYLSEISDLLNAMNIITYFLYVMMLLIIMASTNVTYRLILHERAKEMGVMRAIGFMGKDLQLVLLTEIIALGVISIAAGFILSQILSHFFSFLSFSWFPGFEIFLKNKKLVPLYLPQAVFVNILSLLLVLVSLTVFQSSGVLRKKLTSLLSGESL